MSAPLFDDLPPVPPRTRHHAAPVAWPDWPFDGLEPAAYDFIWADPPWAYAMRGEGGYGKSPQAHYACVDIDDLARLPVAKLAKPDCLLWLWTTWPHLASGQAARALDVEAPLGTVVASGGKHAAVSAFLAQHNTGAVGHAARDPVSTIVGKGCTQAVVAAELAAPILSHAYSSNTAGGQGDPRKPAKTVTTGGHHAKVVAFLTKYFGTPQDPRLEAPLHTATTKPRFGVVTVTIDGEIYALVDIGMRMLVPRELYRAQGFPDTYVIDRLPDGSRLPADAQVRMVGNSVSPQSEAALLCANLYDRAEAPRRMAMIVSPAPANAVREAAE